MRFFSGPAGLEIGNLPLRCAGRHPTRSEALAYYRQAIRHLGLNVRQSSPVLRIDGRDGDFIVRTASDEYCARKVVVATGYYGWPNRLNIPGEELPKVMHYFRDEHPYAESRVMVIGGRNSAGNVALALAEAGAEVTLVHRRDRFSMKPWVLEELGESVSDGRIRVRLNTRAMEIYPDSVSLCTPDGRTEEGNDFVFAMTGYHPDHDFLSTNRIPLKLEGDTLESRRRGVYLAGAVVTGVQGCEINIENGRGHGEQILRDMSLGFVHAVERSA
jgi:thioredoxin reductase (NADPH)